MGKRAERILVVIPDQAAGELIAHQALQPLGYDVSIVNDGSSAIQHAVQFSPDLIIASLDLPGLSGKDLLVALNSQGITTPFIVIVEKGREERVIQAYRLGAADLLVWPARDAEIVNVVERVIRQVRERGARDRLDSQLKQSNLELEQRLKQLTTIVTLGRAVISVTDQRRLFDKIVASTAAIVQADMSWLQLQDERRRNTYLLVSQQGLPEAWSVQLGQPFSDGISTLVALSGETLAIDGEPLRRFKAARLGKSALVAPIKIQQEVIGLLTAIRKSGVPFSKSDQTLIEAITDYASISLVNARLFRALKETAESARKSEERKRDQMQSLGRDLQISIQNSLYPVDLLLTGNLGALTPEQRQTLFNLKETLNRALAAANQAAETQ